MSNYSVLKQDINNNIYENQTQQITGTVLNAILNEMTASLGAGYQFAGVATLGMNPGDPDQRVFYLAGEGIYTNFGGIQVPVGKLGVLKWDNRWTLQTIDGLGGGGANLTGYVSVASTDDLPDEGQPTLGYLCGTNLYLYVGEGGDTKEGKYQDCGSFRGPEGAYIQDIEQTETSHENGGRNTIKMTLSDGRSFNAYVHNGTTSSGLFPTVAALQAAYPNPVVGQYAFVGAGFPADIYVCTTAGTWTDSGEDYDGDNVDLTDYATKAEVNQLEAKVTDIVEGQTSINLFDKTTMIDGFIDASGDVVEHTGAKTSALIPVLPNHYYLLSGRTLMYGTFTIRCLTSDNQKIKVLAAYTGTEYSDYRLPNVDATGRVANGEFKTPSTAAYVQFAVVYESGNGSPDNVMLTDLGDAYVENPPDPEYVPFGTVYKVKDTALSDSLLATIQDSAEKAEIVNSIVSSSPSRNLFNKNDLVDGYYIQDNNGNITPYTGAKCSSPIPVTPGHYYLLSGRTLGGTYAIRCLDASNNVLKVLVASTGAEYTNYSLPKEDGSGGTLNGEFKTPANAVSVQFTVVLSDGSTDKIMLLDLGDTYIPNPVVPGYMPYGNKNAMSVPNGMDNPLYGKSVIFTGDSICHALSDRVGGGGWAKRIGDKNNMLWKNLGVSGGTITSKAITGSPFTISESDWDNGADYIILEGGTNDADIIGSILNGNTPEHFGSYNLTDYTTAFTNTTFCGAVERMLQDVISLFPSARIGFIVAMKMGKTNLGYTPETNNRRAYFETIVQICKKWGVPVLNLWDECMMNPSIASHYTSGQDYLYVDGQHPTGKGYDLITPIIEAWMKTL